MADDDRLPTMVVIDEAIHDRLVMQRDSIVRLETKGVILLGFTATAGQFVLLAHDMQSAWRGVSVAAYAMAFLIGMVVVAPYEHRYPPDPRWLFDNYNAKSTFDVVTRLAAARVKAFEANAGRLERKAKFYRLTLALLLLGVVLSGVARLAGSGDDSTAGPRSGTSSTVSNP